MNRGQVERMAAGKARAKATREAAKKTAPPKVRAIPQHELDEATKLVWLEIERENQKLARRHTEEGIRTMLFVRTEPLRQEAADLESRLAQWDVERPSLLEEGKKIELKEDSGPERVWRTSRLEAIKRAVAVSDLAAEHMRTRLETVKTRLTQESAE